MRKMWTGYETTHDSKLLLTHKRKLLEWLLSDRVKMARSNELKFWE
jgi:hypothetical protein